MHLFVCWGRSLSWHLTHTIQRDHRRSDCVEDRPSDMARGSACLSLLPCPGDPGARPQRLLPSVLLCGPLTFPMLLPGGSGTNVPARRLRELFQHAELPGFVNSFLAFCLQFVSNRSPSLYPDVTVHVGLSERQFQPGPRTRLWERFFLQPYSALPCLDLFCDAL